MKQCFNTVAGIFQIGCTIFLLALTLTCNKDLHDGMYWLSVHYSSSRIDPKVIECKLTSVSGETSLPFGSETVFANPLSLSDSNIISQYTTRNFEKMTGQNTVLQMRYGMIGKWLLLDTLYVHEETLITQDLFIGKLVLPAGDTILKYNAYEYNFGHSVDTIYIKK